MAGDDISGVPDAPSGELGPLPAALPSGEQPDAPPKSPVGRYGHHSVAWQPGGTRLS